MNKTLEIVLVLLALILFLLATFNVVVNKIHLVAAGLAVLTLTWLLILVL